MSPRQFVAWQIYEEIEKFGERRADYRAAQVVAMLHNLAVDGKHQKAVEAFLLKFENRKPVKKMSVKDQIALAIITAQALAGGDT